jgi:hypothetical protein
LDTFTLAEKSSLEVHAEKHRDVHVVWFDIPITEGTVVEANPRLYLRATRDILQLVVAHVTISGFMDKCINPDNETNHA